MLNQTQENIAKLNRTTVEIPKGYYSDLLTIRNCVEDRTIEFMDEFDFQKIQGRPDSGTYFEAEVQWSAWLTWQEIINSDYPSWRTGNYREDEFSAFWRDFCNSYIYED
jgi:hypothetical protein|tara:strand:+ start:877 stop:1203 length:327 start_codon:yes stop_codon:yes gene_type:complete